MIFYTSDGRKYEGMDQMTVQSLLNDMGLSCTFVDKTTYDAYVVAHRVTL
jgi:hypothetical protein